MSLINEALKRARQTHTQHATTHVAEAPLEPVLRTARERKPLTWLPAAAYVTILLLGLWCIALWWRSAVSVATPAPAHDPAADSAQAAMAIAARFAAIASNSSLKAPALPVFVGASEHAKMTEPAAPAVHTATPAASIPGRASTAMASHQAAPAPTPAPVQALVETPPAPSIPREPQSNDTPPTASAIPASALKLQGIFYRLNKASVLINNQTLFVGDEIDGTKVIGIERHAVRLQIAGKTQVMKLR
jgi:hypothetical protein